MRYLSQNLSIFFKVAQSLILLFSPLLLTGNAKNTFYNNRNAVEIGMRSQTSSDDNKKLVFIHHSCGGQLLADNYGGLGNALKDAGYFVSDINYGWSAAGNDVYSNNLNIGNQTDTGEWYIWFADERKQNGKPRRDNIMGSVYTEYGQHNNNSSNAGWNFGDYTRLSTDPGGENEIIMFKSCYPNINLYTDTEGAKTILGKNHDDAKYSVQNCKELYNTILPYFKEHPEKMFILITSPALAPNGSGPTPFPGAHDRARELNNWLVNNWLQEAEGGDWSNKNVYVWDYFNILTGVDNHHWVVGGEVQHVIAPDSGNARDAAYSSNQSNDEHHPSKAGTQKATAELVPCLDVWYATWKDWLNRTTALDGDIQYESKYTVSPNPADTYVRISTAFVLPDNAQLNIFDITGKSVYREEIGGKNNITVSTRNFRSGLYIIQINTATSQLFNSKLIVK